jgi:HNH endonuclease
MPVSLHAGPIKLSKRGRDDVERRFQNPGQSHPVRVLPNTIPLLVGLWEDGPRPVFVAMGDVVSRVGKDTRQSLFIPLWLLNQAAVVGWSTHDSTSYERLTAFHPKLLPAYVEMMASRTDVAPELILSALDASGINDPTPIAPDERARRATMALVRDQGFRRRVINAYGGLCAMCGLNLGLVEGAHIYPASAPGAPDEVWNGIALCSNHHGAFDRQMIYIDPLSRSVVMHPDLARMADKRPVCRQFIETTFSTLSAPADPAAHPRTDLLVKRYEYYEAGYSWVKPA